MKKSYLAILLAVLMVFVLSFGAFAAEPNADLLKISYSTDAGADNDKTWTDAVTTSKDYRVSASAKDPLDLKDKEFVYLKVAPNTSYAGKLSNLSISWQSKNKAGLNVAYNVTDANFDDVIAIPVAALGTDSNYYFTISCKSTLEYPNAFPVYYCEGLLPPQAEDQPVDLEPYCGIWQAENSPNIEIKKNGKSYEKRIVGEVSSQGQDAKGTIGDVLYKVAKDGTVNENLYFAVGYTVNAYLQSSINADGSVTLTAMDDYSYRTAEGANAGAISKDAAYAKKIVAQNTTTDKTYSWLDQAVADMQPGETIKLLDDLTAAKKVTISTGKDVTVDLNGHDLSFAQNQNFTINGGKLTVTGTGKVSEEKPYYAPILIYGASTDQADYSVVNVGKDVTLEGWSGIFIDKSAKDAGGKYHALGVKVDFQGTINSVLDTSDDAGHGIYINGLNQDIEGNFPQITTGPDSVITSKGNGIYGAGFAQWNLAGSITAPNALSIKSGIYDISGGAYHSTGAFADPADANGNGSEDTGAALSITSNDGYAKKTVVNVTGGTFTSDNGYAVYEGIAKKADGSSAAKESYAKLTISDGEFTGNAEKGSVLLAAMKATDYAITGGTFNPSLPVSITGDATTNYYPSLTQAVEAAKSGDTIVLHEDVAPTSAVIFDKKDNAVTLDLNGHNIESKHNSVTLYVWQGAALNIVDNSGNEVKGSISNLGEKRGASNTLRVDGNTASEQNGPTEPINSYLSIAQGIDVYADHGAGVAVFGNGAKADIACNVSVGDEFSPVSGNGTNGANNSYAHTVININEGANIVSEKAVAIYAPQNGIVNINGGNVTGLTAIGIKAGELNINGGKLTATGEYQYADDKDYPVNSNGIDLDGSTIVLDGNKAYKGNVTVNIKGGELVSANGHVFREVRTNVDAEVSLLKLNISGNPTLTATSGKDVIRIPADSKGTVAVTGGQFSPILKSQVTTAPLADNKYNEATGKWEALPNSVNLSDYTASYSGSTIYLTAKTVPYHTNAVGNGGNWVGVAFSVPQYYEVAGEASYVFGENKGTFNLDTPDFTVDGVDYYAFYINASAENPKTNITIDWDGDAKPLLPVSYTVNLKNVVYAPQGVPAITAVENINDSNNNSYYVSDQTVATLSGQEIKLTGAIPYKTEDTNSLGMPEGNRFALKLSVANIADDTTMSVSNGDGWNTYTKTQFMDGDDFLYLVGNATAGKTMQVKFQKDGADLAAYTISWEQALLSPKNLEVVETAKQEVSSEVAKEDQEVIAALPAPTMTGLANAVSEDIINDLTPDEGESEVKVEIGVKVTVLPTTKVDASVLAFEATPYVKVGEDGEEKPLSNDDLKDVKNPITLKFALPDNFVVDGLQVRHIKEDGKTEYLVPNIIAETTDKGVRYYAEVTIYDFSQIIIENQDKFTVNYDLKLPADFAGESNNPNEDTPELQVADLPYELLDASATGYDFAGWYVADGNNTVVDITEISGSTLNDYANSQKVITIYAKWTAAASTVTFDSAGGGAVAAQTVSYGGKAVEPKDPASPVGTFNTFVGWYLVTDGEMAEEPYDFNTAVTENITLKAKWQPTESKYGFEVDAPQRVDANTEYDNVKVTLKATEVKDTGLDKNGLILISVKAKPEGSNPVLNATDAEGNTYNLAETGVWGPPQGFPVSKDYNATTDIKATFDKDGAYSFEFKLVKLAGEGVQVEKAKYTYNVEVGVTQYTVDFNSNGGSYVAPVKVAKAATLTLPAAPTKEDYNFAGWYTDAALEKAFVADTPITADMTLYAKWDKNIVYVDVPSTFWGYADIMAMTDLKLFNGEVINGENYFKPADNMTRAQFVTVLGRYEGVTESEYSAADYAFTDISSGVESWAGSYIAWASENGIVNGTSETTFEPNKSVSRQEMATIIGRYLDYKEYAVEADWNAVNFSDKVQVKDWAQDGVAICVQSGIIEGFDDNTFRPADNMNRAQGATVMSRIVKLFAAQ